MRGGEVLNKNVLMLREHGLRATPQRELIMQILQDSKEHPSAENIYAIIKKLHPSLSLNTVYNTLDVFEQKGLIRKFNVGVNIYRYDANTAHHPHFVCNLCQKVEDLPVDFFKLTGKLKEDIERHTACIIEYADIYFYGLCPHCR